MADLQRILGTMLSTGLGGHRRRMPSFEPAALGGAMGGLTGGQGGRGGFMRGAGLAALGYLAYRAYQDRQANQPRQGQGAGAAPAGQRESSEPSLLDRLGGLFNPSGSSEARAPSGSSEARAPSGAAGANAGGGAAPPEAALDDRKALLLIRAMIAAAYADGEIDPAERQRILGKLEEAGADREDRELVERELRSPLPLDTLLREVDNPETAEQVYVASHMAIDVDTEAERSYLNYLAARLNLDSQRIEALNRIGA